MVEISPDTPAPRQTRKLATDQRNPQNLKKRFNQKRRNSLDSTTKHTNHTKKPHSRAIFCRAGVPPAIEQFTPAGGTPALHFKSPHRASAGDASDRTFSTTSTGKSIVIVIILRFLIAEKTQRFFFIRLP
jgi:hypothetical protein